MNLLFTRSKKKKKNPEGFGFMASMEEMRQTAMTYYKTVPKHVKKLADEFFSAMDDNRDGKISLHEFAAFMSEQGYDAMNNQSFFDQINKNKSGNLDFEDVITLFYILKSGRPLCGGCRKLIEGLYFTCVKCYYENKSFCLHPKCFEGGKYVHHGHAEFLDNYALLQRQKGLMATPKPSKFSRFKHSFPAQVLPHRLKWFPHLTP
ncbi:RAS guanyl-releasing protein like [Actinidia chinensis var. chinensis]|uniref:RAS guanyl-releasing protein like n=1 Tax=Actinidia chinensis var. chinensis TaxID=1590841 RepID=A0A2R6R912_ACTCC|nr:RAS guanyl-releasing protein like [Actinidia chinensis var. chinensis]